VNKSIVGIYGSNPFDSSNPEKKNYTVRASKLNMIVSSSDAKNEESKGVDNS